MGNNQYIVERVFHPVGQGAFFTEQFFCVETHELVFSVVYDCGAWEYTNPSQTILEHEIDFTFNSNQRKIDCIFFSHIDLDHISGLRYLKKQKYVDEKTTRIILPLCPHPIKWLLCDDDEATALAETLELIEQFENVTYVSDTDAPLGNDPREYRGIAGSNSDIADKTGRDTVNTGHIFNYEGIWEYIPFNIYGDDAIYTEFENELKLEPAFSGYDLTDTADIIKILNDTHLRAKLSEIYKSFKKTRKQVGNDTSFTNINSLILLSKSVYALKSLNMNFTSLVSRMNVLFCVKKLSSLRRIPKETDSSSCLYTGDTDFSGQQAYENLMKRALAYLDKQKTQLMFLQIPHHGSKNNYNPQIPLDSYSRFVFTNFSPKCNVFYTQIIFDFLRSPKTAFYVTENKASEVKTHYHLWKP